MITMPSQDQKIVCRAGDPSAFRQTTTTESLDCLFRASTVRGYA
jgi:hypothetical protein